MFQAKKVWLASFVAIMAGTGCAFAFTISGPGSTLTDLEAKHLIGGGVCFSQCQTECSGINVPCSTAMQCNQGPNHLNSPGDRCSGAGGGTGNANNCVNRTGWSNKCCLQGASSSCTPNYICRWNNPRAPADLAELRAVCGNERTNQDLNSGNWTIMDCIQLNMPGAQSGYSSCTNVVCGGYEEECQ